MFQADHLSELVINNLLQLSALILQQQGTLLARWRAELKQLDSAKDLDLPTLNDHIPGLLKELAVAFQLRADESIAEAHIETPPAHGLQRLIDGFEIEEVVAEYNILRGCIHDLAIEYGLSLEGRAFHILNRVLDGAIGAAVRTYAHQSALEVQRRREEYLSFVAHDLRTPLNAISLAARVLDITAEDQTKQTQKQQMLQTLHRNVQHLATLVAKILEENTNLQTERGLKLERRTLDLWPLIENLIHDLHPVAGTGSTRLSNQVPLDLMVYADASLLRRIFQNLIANAIMYTPDGTISITANTLPDGHGVSCAVADNGTGIAADKIARIFEKFEGDDNNTTGMGLGLAIFKTFVEAHGGNVFVESKVGVGSVFRFTLPAPPAGSKS